MRIYLQITNVKFRLNIFSVITAIESICCLSVDSMRISLPSEGLMSWFWSVCAHVTDEALVRSVWFHKGQGMSGTSPGGLMARAFLGCLLNSAAAVLLDSYNLEHLYKDERQVTRSLAVCSQDSWFMLNACNAAFRLSLKLSSDLRGIAVFYVARH